MFGRMISHYLPKERRAVIDLFFVVFMFYVFFTISRPEYWWSAGSFLLTTFYLIPFIIMRSAITVHIYKDSLLPSDVAKVRQANGQRNLAVVIVLVGNCALAFSELWATLQTMELTTQVLVLVLASFSVVLLGMVPYFWYTVAVDSAYELEHTL